MDHLTYRWINKVLLFYTTYISVDLAHHKIFRAKVGKGGIKTLHSCNFLSYKGHQMYYSIGANASVSLLSSFMPMWYFPFLFFFIRKDHLVLQNNAR